MCDKALKIKKGQFSESCFSIQRHMLLLVIRGFNAYFEILINYTKYERTKMTIM